MHLETSFWAIFPLPKDRILLIRTLYFAFDPQKPIPIWTQTVWAKRQFQNERKRFMDRKHTVILRTKYGPSIKVYGLFEKIYWPPK